MVEQRDEADKGARRRGLEAPLAKEAWIGRLVVACAALICLFFVVPLRDVLLLPFPPQPIPAPPVPTELTQRDASLSVTVVDEAERPIVGASVRVFALHKNVAYFAADRDTGPDGHARLEKLPRGEVWVLGYAKGRARASLHAVLSEGLREARLLLGPARALDLVVVDEAARPVEGATIEVFGTDPLPYSAMSEANGSARVDRLGSPPYRVRVSALGFDDALRAGVVPGATPLRIRLERLSTLEVRVVDKDGRPASGANLLVVGTGLWPSRSSITDENGNVRLAGLHGGAYDLKASRGDEVSRTEFGVALKRGELKKMELKLEEGKRVTVTVTDGAGDGAPAVKGASVVLVEGGLSSFPLHGKTDEHGVVVLGPLARERASVSARALGFVQKSAVAIDADATSARVGLERGGVLSGDVVDERGFPIAGASLEVVGVDAEGMPIDETTAMAEFREEHFASSLPGPMPLIPTGELGVMPGPIPDLPHGAFVPSSPEAPRGGDPWVTRADGTFRADPIPPGRVHVIVRHPEYVEAMSEVVTVRSGEEAKVHVVLRQGGVLEGRVLEDDRTPIPFARIELSATHGSLERVAYAGEDGSFTFAAAPDEVLLSVARPDAPADVVARLVVVVPERDRKRIEILLPKQRDAVAIHVKDDRGYPADRVEVHVASLELKEPLYRTLFTDPGGDVELRGALGLPLRITLIRPGKAPRVETIDSAPPKLSFSLEDGVRGRGVVTGRGGRDRLAGVEVTLFTASGARRARTDAEGSFTIEDLAPGRARLTAFAPEHAPAEAVIRVQGDRDHPADLGTIDLPEAGTVAGIVVDAEDKPVAGARVAQGAVPTYLPLGPLPRGIVATDREGRFSLGGLPEGNVALEAYFADLGRASVENVAVRAGRATERVKIVLPHGAAAKEPKGAGSVAVTLGERAEGSSATVVVVMVPPGSEAEASGVEPGDEIVSINGHEVHAIETARRRLSGPLGEDVLLSLRRPDETGASSLLLRVRRERVRR